MAKILISDPMDKGAIQKIIDAGHEVIERGDGDFKEMIPEFDACTVRSMTKVRTDSIDVAKNLKLIVRGGVGIDNIDHQYAKTKGIEVRNTPLASSNSVAELAIAHMFAVARFLPDSNITMKKGEWNKKKYKGFEIMGKTLGLIGIGNIGCLTAQKALALGMKVVATDPFVKCVDMDVDIVSLDQLLEQADIISLHIPFDKEKGATLGAEQFNKMKDGVVIINAARGGTVCEKALLDALNSGKVAYAGIDVFEKEPTDNTELVNHPNVSVTPHIGAQTKEATKRVGEEVADIIIDFFK